MNRRQRMYATNKYARDWLIENGYDMIWLKRHEDLRKAKNQETYYTKSGNYFMTDIYNLFDGMCFDSNGTLTLLQISTTSFHKKEPYQQFMQGKKGFVILLIKVVNLKGGWTVRTITIS